MSGSIHKGVTLKRATCFVCGRRFKLSRRPARRRKRMFVHNGIHDWLCHSHTCKTTARIKAELERPKPDYNLEGARTGRWTSDGSGKMRMLPHPSPTPFKTHYQPPSPSPAMPARTVLRPGKGVV